MSAELIKALTLSLLMTLALETGFFYLSRKRDVKDLTLLFAVNVITNPVIVLLFWLSALYTDWGGIAVALPLELSAILVEGYYYDKYGRSFKRPYAFSAAANAFSFTIGAIVQLLIS